MIRVLATIDDKEMTYSGFVIAQSNQVIKLRLFEDDLNFGLGIRVEFTERGGVSTKRVEGSDDVQILRHRRPWDLSKPTGGSIEEPIAYDDDHNFYMSFSVTPLGSQSNSFYQFSYAILREAR